MTRELSTLKSSYLYCTVNMLPCLWIAVFHPHVGQVLNAVAELVNVFEVFLPQLLLYPNPTDPLNGDAAALLIREPESFDRKVRGATFIMVAAILAVQHISRRPVCAFCYVRTQYLTETGWCPGMDE